MERASLLRLQLEEQYKKFGDVATRTLIIFDDLIRALATYTGSGTNGQSIFSTELFMGVYCKITVGKQYRS